MATFNFTGGTLQAAPGNGLSVAIPITPAPSSQCMIDMNGQQVSLQSLTTSSLADLNFATPGVDLLTIQSDMR